MMPHSEPKREVAAIIAKLLTHFRQPDESLAVFNSLADDWVDAFLEFDVDIVADAAREWLWSQKWKPTIAELRQICERLQIKRERALPPPRPPPGVPAWFDVEMQRLWEPPEFEGDDRTPWERRSAALARQRQQPSASDGRALANEWARGQGYVDFATAEKAGRRYGEVVRWVLARAKPKRMPLEPGDRPLSRAAKADVRRESVDFMAEAAE